MATDASKGYTSSARLAIPVSSYYSVKTNDWGNIQPAIPTFTPGSFVAYWYVQLPNTFRMQKPVQYIKPAGALDPLGVVIGEWQVTAPEDPGRSQSITSGSNTYWYLNGYLFLCTSSGTTGAAVPASMASPSNLEPGTSAYSKGATVTDGTATWTCQGRQVLIVSQLVNLEDVSSPYTSIGPTPQEIDFFQL